MTTPLAHQTYELFVRATPDAVWRAMCDPAMTAQYFFGTKLSSTLEPGTPYAYVFQDARTAVDGEILAVERGRRLEMSWVIRYDPSLSDERSVVTWSLEPRGAHATKLTVTHDCARAPRTAAHVGKDGWSLVLSGLKTLVETGAPLVIGQ